MPAVHFVVADGALTDAETNAKFVGLHACVSARLAELVGHCPHERGCCGVGHDITVPTSHRFVNLSRGWITEPLTTVSDFVMVSVMETLTTRQAADRIALQTGRRVPTSTMHEWIADKRLQFVIKLPGLRGAYLFDPAHVDAFATALNEERAA